MASATLADPFRLSAPRQPIPALDLAAMVGPTDWARLPACLRRRFDVSHGPARYDGTMDLARSAIGGWFARLATLFGAPLPVRRATGAPVTVTVRTQNGGTVWERRFGTLHRVRSVKSAGPGNTVIERTDGGLAMVLDVSVEDDALVFTSRRFFLSLGSWRLPIPTVLTPGTCRVEHRAIDEHRFTFSMTMTHPLWGTTFRQNGLFNDPPESSTMNAVFAILSIQALFGAFDNFWHHELEAKLPRQVSARYELRLHAAREAIYGVLFLGLAWLRWDGAGAWVLAILLAAEVLITLADFIEEDMTRRLPPLERVLHTILAISYGGFIAALAPVLVRWAGQPTGLIRISHGPVSLLFTLYAAGVLAWSVRNAIAVVRLSRDARPTEAPVTPPSGPAVLVTGATGFVGSALVRTLLADGQRVIVLTRDARRAAATFGPRVGVTETLDTIPGETPIEAVVNLAGAPIVGGRWSAWRHAKLVDSRVDVTSGVVALMRRLDRKPLVLVSASAVGFYGIERVETELDETAREQPGTFQSDLCAAWEQAAMRADARVVCLRFGVVLGKSGGLYPPLALASGVGLGAVLGRGDQPMPWIHLDDAIGLIRFAIDTPLLDGAVNAVAPDCPSQAVFVRTMARSLGAKVRLRVPAWPLWRLGGEAAQLLLEGQAATPKAALAAGYGFLHRTLESATADLAGGYRIREGGATHEAQSTAA